MKHLASDGFALRLQAARSTYHKAGAKHLGMNQTELADALGVTQGSVSHWEGGSTKKLGLATVEQIAVALGVRPCWLAFGDGPMRQSDVRVDDVPYVSPRPARSR